LVAWCHSFCLFFIFFYNIYTLIQSRSYNTYFRRHSPGPLSISSSLESSVEKAFLWYRAENRTRACPTASQSRHFFSSSSVIKTILLTFTYSFRCFNGWTVFLLCSHDCIDQR
jgi:hypothetical protein